MPIKLVANQKDAASAHALVIRMCEDSGYPERPSAAAFTKMVLNNPDDIAFFLAEDSKKMPIGITMLSKAFSPYLAAPYGIFTALYVLPNHRKTGLAEELFTALQQEAKKRGWTRIDWFVYENNAASNGFFAKQGFAPEEHKLGYYYLPTKKIRTAK